MPIQVSLDRQADESSLLPCEKLNNVSLGGLAFISTKALSIGQKVSVSFPLIDQQHSLSGEVVWSKPVDTGFEIGLQFEDPDEIYSLRMIEQVCHIEHYRQEVEQFEGRRLTSEEAAREWIGLYASEFPALDS